MGDITTPKLSPYEHHGLNVEVHIRRLLEHLSSNKRLQH
jgi:hypothetical protein